MADNNQVEDKKAPAKKDLLTIEEFLRPLSMDDVTRKWYEKNNQDTSRSAEDWNKTLKLEK